MKSFGVPQIQVRIGNVGRQAVTSVQITQMNGTHVAGFTSEEAAKSYEESVFAQAKSAMDAIRQRKDDFSSTVEVEI